MERNTWTYVAEGGKHALFASPFIPGKLLRVEKRFLRSTATPITMIERTPSDFDDPLDYFKSFISPFVSPYVDEPEVIILDQESLEMMRKEAIESGRIPSARNSDWRPIKLKDAKISKYRPFGLVLPNYTTLPIAIAPENLDGHTLSGTICIELKPKAGYLSLSPLIEPCHRIKLSQSRFSLLQQLHQNGFVEKGWAKGCENVRRSYYDPLDLFSNDTIRMKKAVKNLLECPQNNLKLWYRSKLLTEPSAVKWDDASEIIKDAMGNVSPSINATRQEIQYNCSNFIANTIVSILQRENILDKLKTLQMLDVLDADGMVRVSERLLELCGGCRRQVEKIISEQVPRSSDDEVPPRTFGGSPFAATGQTDAMTEFCEVVDSFRKVVTDGQTAIPSTSTLDEYFDRAKTHVAKLGIQDCAFLLSNWLLSLAMCDVSVFITMQKAEQYIAIGADGSRNWNCDGKGQGIANTPIDEDVKVAFAYSVRMIDCDRKPPGKLWGRKEKEAAFSSLSHRSTMAS